MFASRQIMSVHQIINKKNKLKLIVSFIERIYVFTFAEIKPMIG